MRDSLRREIDMGYEAQRAANHAEEARRLAQATEADAMIGHLVGERMRMFQEGARAAIANPHEATAISENLTGRIASMQGELRDRLEQAGFPVDYLQPVYSCPHCHDTGFVGDPIRERCACFERKLRELIAQDMGHGLDLRETFEAYDDSVYSDEPLGPGNPDTQRSFMARVRALCEAYAVQYPKNPRRNLLFFGMSGLGKTYMLNSIGNQVHRQGGEVAKVTAYQLTERMRAATFGNDPAAFSSLLETPLLLLDDLGAEPLYNNITIEHMFTLLNERMLADRHTVVSTNLMLDELRQRYTERVCSRLFDTRNTTIVEFRGSDVRLR